MKRGKTVLLVLVTGILLCGCAGNAFGTGKFSPEANGVYVTRNGSVSSALVETYEKDHYDEESLRTYLEENVTRYNTAHSGTTDTSPAVPVMLESCSVGNGVMTAVFNYASVNDLIQFSKENKDESVTLKNLELTTVADGLVQGKITDGSFVKAEDASPVSNDRIMKKSTLYLVTVEGAARVQTEGKILYMTDQVTLVNDKTVTTPEGKSYLIFE